MSKNNSWFPFLLGAAIGSAITWLLMSEEGKKIVKKWEKKGTNLLNDLLDQETENSEETP